MLALQKQFGQSNIGAIVVGRNQADTGCFAAFDLMHQARPRAMGKYTLLTGSQEKCFLDQLNRFTGGKAIGKRPEVVRMLFEATTVVKQAWKLAATERDIGVRLVVAEQDVVFGREFLDERVFKNQRFSFAARCGRFNLRDLSQHQQNPWALTGLLKVR